MTSDPHTDGQVEGTDRQTLALSALAVVAVVVVGIGAATSGAGQDVTLYRGLVLTGVLALASVRLWN